MTTANGIVIDPFSREVRKVDYDIGLQGIKDAIGLKDSPIDWVTLHRFPNGASLGLYVDDEGLLNNQEVQRFWCLPEEHGTLLAGKALLCFVRPDGDCEDIPAGLYDLIFTDLATLRPPVWLGDAWETEKALKAGQHGLHQPTSSVNGEVFFRWEAPQRQEGSE